MSSGKAPPPPVARKDKSKVRVVRAMYPYQAQRSDELTFDEGDILYIVDDMTNKEWWKCRCRGKEGLVPFNYVDEKAETVDNPMHEAAKRGNLEFLRELLEGGVSVNGLDATGNSPIHWAARGGHIEAVKMILASKPVLDVRNKLGDTPLHSAAWGGHAAVIQLLIDAGENTSIQNKDGKTPFQLAKTVEAASILQEFPEDSYVPGDEDPDSD